MARSHGIGRALRLFDLLLGTGPQFLLHALLETERPRVRRDLLPDSPSFRQFKSLARINVRLAISRKVNCKAVPRYGVMFDAGEQRKQDVGYDKLGIILQRADKRWDGIVTNAQHLQRRVADYTRDEPIESCIPRNVRITQVINQASGRLIGTLTSHGTLDRLGKGAWVVAKDNAV